MFPWIAKQRLREVEKQLRQLQCPHKHIKVIDEYGAAWAVCMDCGKYIRGFDTWTEALEFKKELEIKRHEQALAEIEEEIERLSEKKERNED